MRRSTSVSLCLLVLLHLLLAQDKQTLAVLDFEALGISESEVKILTDRLRSNLVQIGLYKVIDRGQMQTVLEEQDFQQTGCVSDECAVEVGQLLGAQVMIAGSIGRLGALFTIEMRMIDVRTGGIIRSASHDVRGELEEVLIEGIPEAARRILSAGTLEFASDPPGATVSIDGEMKGTTPIQPFALLVGRYTISVILEGYKTIDTTVVIEVGRTSQLSLTLEPAPGILEITSSPPGAGVTINGEVRGATPLPLIELEVGTYSIRINLERYNTLDTTVFVEAGRTYQFSFTLEPIPGTIEITSVPPGATVAVNSEMKGRTPLLPLEVDVGTYTISLSLERYKTIDTTVAVEAGQTYPFVFALEPAPGTLEIISVPPSATVAVNGEVRGTTPLEPFELDIGTYDISLSLDRHKSLDTTVVIEAGEVYRFSFDLELAPSSLEISSAPLGATVAVDGAMKGATPLPSIGLDEGTHTLTLSMERYKTLDTTVTLEAGQSYQFSFDLELAPSSLEIASVPPGATVMIDSVVRGTTPLSELELEAGTYEISLSLERYMTLDTTVVLEGGLYYPFSVTLEPIPGTLEVASEPPGASVAVNGEVKGTTPLPPLGLEVGTHALSLNLDRYKAFDTTVVVEAAQAYQFSFDLELAPSSLEITTLPPGATVAVNGEMKGTTPLPALGLDEGTYALSLNLERYMSLDTTVVLEAGQIYQFSFDLELAPSSLEITTFPPGATVAVNGDVKGTTPLPPLGLAEGIYAIRLTLERYQTLDTTAVLVAGESSLYSYNLKATHNWLTIEGNEAAEVFIDGNLVGKLPLQRQLYPIGRYELLAQKPGYSPFNTRFPITAENETVIQFTLKEKPRVAALAFSAILPGSGQMYIGERKKGMMLLATAASAGFWLYRSHMKYQQNLDYYHSHVMNYETATSLDEIARERASAVACFNAARENEIARNVTAGVLTSIWLVSVFDVSNINAAPIALSIVLPGSGQLYRGERNKGLLFLTAAIGTGLAAYAYHWNYQRYFDDYHIQKTDYENATNIEDIASKRALAVESYNAARYSQRGSNLFTGLFTGIWLINILDITF